MPCLLWAANLAGRAAGPRSFMRTRATTTCDAAPTSSAAVFRIVLPAKASIAMTGSGAIGGWSSAPMLGSLPLASCEPDSSAASTCTSRCSPLLAASSAFDGFCRFVSRSKCCFCQSGFTQVRMHRQPRLGACCWPRPCFARVMSMSMPCRVLAGCSGGRTVAQKPSPSGSERWQPVPRARLVAGVVPRRKFAAWGRAQFIHAAGHLLAHLAGQRCAADGHQSGAPHAAGAAVHIQSQIVGHRAAHRLHLVHGKVHAKAGAAGAAAQARVRGVGASGMAGKLGG